MAYNSVVTNNGRKIMMNRCYKASPDYLSPTQYSIGIDQTEALITDTALDSRVPISNGTVCDNGDQQFTGSNGGDNTTDNTTTYKEGGGESDETAQNMIANDTNATKTWTSPDLAVAGSDMVGTKPFAFWLYIKDATAFAKFVSAGTALQIRIRTNGDAANLSYLQSWTASQLAVGWNWCTSGTTNVEDMTQGAGGPPSGDLNEVIIEITTNNATDEFVAGDVVYDMLRQWATTDLVSTYVTGYPTFDETNHEVTIRCYLSSVQANGFLLDGFALFNEDTSPLMHSIDNFEDLSKNETDEVAFIVVDKIEERD